MSVSTPLISIGMPVLNSQDTLLPAINSLFLQTCSNWELLLIDDGSTDRTLEIISKLADPRLRTFRDGKRLGLAARLNQAIASSRGKYFARMDADDVTYPRRLEHQLLYLEQHPDVDMVGAGMMVFRSDGTALGKRLGPETSAAICARPSGGFPMGHPTYFGHRAWFRRYGYKEEVVGAVHEDQDLLLRSYRTSKIANVPEILHGYRENKLDLAKFLNTRKWLAKSLFRTFREQGRLPVAILAVAEQVVKAGVDCIAIGSGLGYHLLRHRAQPITADERCEWERVWKAVNNEDASRTSAFAAS